MMSYQDYLKRIYYDPKHPASFAGVEKLYRAVRKDGKFVLSRNKIRKWLVKQEDYAVHKEEKSKFRRRRVIAPFVDYQWDVDTADMRRYEDQKYKYFLLAVDIMSKYVWTVPLRTKTAAEIVKAFQTIFKEGRKPTRIRSDKGSEYVNKDVRKYLKDEKIVHFVTQNIVKASVAEKAIKTIKSRIAHFMTHNQTHRWVEVLPKLTKSYNTTYHRSIKRTPASVKPSDHVELWKELYESNRQTHKSSPKSYKFRVGDIVRVSFLRRQFQRQYDERWSRDLFVVTERFMKEGIPQYKLKDYSGEIVTGTFYQKQLSKAYEQEMYLIERVLKSRKKAGQKEYLVRWKGWAPKYDSWVSETDVESINKASSSEPSS
ncbi:MAG: DDE-type integrase/transposase/recombinase [Candidatus Thiodiazotropha endolucinida]